MPDVGQDAQLESHDIIPVDSTTKTPVDSHAPSPGQAPGTERHDTTAHRAQLGLTGPCS